MSLPIGCSAASATAVPVPTDAPNAFDAGPVPGGARKPARRRPAAVAVHDDGDGGRHAFRQAAHPCDFAATRAAVVNTRTAATKTTPSAVHTSAHKNVPTRAM